MIVLGSRPFTKEVIFNGKKHSTDNKVNDVNKVKKDIMLRVRVTAEEREKFTVIAKEKGFKSVSEYIRSLVAEEKKPERL